MKRYIVLCIMVLLFIFSGLGCSETVISKTDAEKEKPLVAVSIVPEATFVKEVAGDLVDVVTMIPPGNSPSNYAPSPQEISQLSDAKIYFSIEVPTEDANIIPKIPELNKKLKIVNLATEVRKAYPDLTIDSGHRDPHIWLSPKRVQKMIDSIARELGEIDPSNKATYMANAKGYKEKLEGVEKEVAEILENSSQKTFIIFHPSLGYFADDFGLKMIALEEHGKEATIDNLKNVIDTAKKEKINAVFYQAEHDSTQARTVASEIGGKTVEVAPLHSNYIVNLKKIARSIADENSN